MQQAPSNFFIHNTFQTYDNCNANKNKEFTTSLVAMKNGNIYPVILSYSKHGTPYLIFNEVRAYVDSYFRIYDGYASLKGYKILDTTVAKLDELLQKEHTYLQQCERGVELATQRISNFNMLKSQHPEYFI